MELLKYGIKKHPYWSCFFVWLYTFCTLGRFYIDKVTLFNYTSVVITGVLFIFAENIFSKKIISDEEERKKDFIRTSVCTAIVSLYVLATLFVFSHIPLSAVLRGRNYFVIMISVGVFFIAGAIALTIMKKWNYSSAAVFIFALGFFVHVIYIIITGLIYQMDLGSFFSEGNGHMGYIEYIYNNFSLPQFDPREKWQYYHPPLNHIAAALFLRIQTLFGLNIRIALYNITYLPLIYCMFTIITFYLLGKEFLPSGTPRIVYLANMIFFPAIIIVGGYVNNDMPSIMLGSMALYFSIKWYKNRSARNIIYTALCFGLGMFTKMSVWMMALPIAVIFISALAGNLKTKNYKEFKRLTGQMIAFLAVAVPLSFYWSLRNYIRFGVPIGYIPLNNDDTQIITVSPVQRIFDFRLFQWETNHVSWIDNAGDTYNEYNPLIAMIKSASVGIGETLVSDRIMFFLKIIWFALAFVCIIYIMIKKDSMPLVFKAAFSGMFVLFMFSYYLFCIKYPHICTEDIRYVLPLIFTGSLFIAMTVGQLSKKRTIPRRILKTGIIAFTVLFCTFTVYQLVLLGYFMK